MLTLVKGSSKTHRDRRDTGRPDDSTPGAAQPCPREREFVAALAAGDERAFTELVAQYHRPLVRQALAFVPSEAVAEEVVQETWLAVMDSIKRFEGRSSLKTWLYQILIHKAKSAGVKESRQVPLSAMGMQDDDADDVTLEAKVAAPVDSQGRTSEWAGMADEGGTAEDVLEADECRREIACAIQALPQTQRRVMELYHFQGISSEEVCRRLDISETNKHVLLHRGRLQVKKAVDRYFAGDRRRASVVRAIYQQGLAA